MPLLSRLLSPLALAFALSSVHAGALGGEILIDFESVPGADGILGTADDAPVADTFLQPLGDQFAQVGVVFSQGTLLQSGFFDGSSSNHFISSTNPIGYFTRGISGISIDSFSRWDATLTAYDRFGNVLASNTLVNPQTDGAFLRGVLSVTTTELIYGFSILPTNPDYILNLDNLRLTTVDAAAAIPEPGPLAMLGAGLALMVAARRRRARPVS